MRQLEFSIREKKNRPYDLGIVFSSSNDFITIIISQILLIDYNGSLFVCSFEVSFWIRKLASVNWQLCLLSWNRIYLGQLLWFILFQFEIIAVEMAFRSKLLCHFNASHRSGDITKETICASNSIVHWTSAASIKTHSLRSLPEIQTLFGSFSTYHSAMASPVKMKIKRGTDKRKTHGRPASKFNKLIFISLFVYIVIW